ncbi:hypothetical protein [Bradyrhizobium sp. S69]|uniref:hypothetical protein n=1 Tax=Bradyrhizobium sp. S69 TaxID=1641856 RepID=UPI00131A93A8|nr:hypothetical protein [Bradyrhizobium sp. S69]
MSNDLVVQLGAKLDQFQSDMNSAGDMADSAVSRIESSFASLNPTAGGFGTFFTAAAAGFTGILAYVVSLNKQLADMQATAEQVGLTLKDFQGVQFGGQVAGLSTDQINDGLQKSASLLNDAARNSNSLSKELDANGISVKNANGQLISQNQLLQIAAGLVSNAATPQDAIVIAQMLGFTQEWVPLLQQGATAMGTLSDQATAAGAVIDDATIKKATDFNAAWQKSSTEFATYMKAAIADLLPGMDDLIQRGAKFLQSIKDKGGGAQGILGSLGLGLTIGSGDNKKVVTIDADSLNKAAEEFKNAPAFSLQFWADAGALLASPFKLTPLGAPGTGADALNSSAYPQSGPKSIADVQAHYQHLADQKQDDAQDANDKHTVIDPRDVPADAYDRAQNQVEKSTAKTSADADAQGLGAGDLAAAEAQTKLDLAAKQAGIALTQQQIDKNQDLAQDAGEAADALAKAKVASNISFGQQTALLTPQDLTIATQLKSIYGNDIPAAMASSEAASLKFNATIKDLGSLGQQVNSQFFVDFETQIRNGASAMQALQTAGVNALGAIADKLTKMAADNLWSSAFGGSSGGSILSLFGLGSTPSINANGSISGAAGPTSVGGAPLVGQFAGGTDNAPGGLSLVGEHGPELLNIPKGGQVIPNDVLKGGNGGSVIAPMNFTINAPNADAAGLAKLQVQLNQLQAELPARVVSAVTMAKKQRRL